jgi:micrococcal nuclease
MRRAIGLLFLGLCAGVWAQESVKVVGVTDGDTLTVLSGSKSIKVRLDGVDAPETRQPFGSASKKWLSDRVFGKTVKYKEVDRDRYGRSVGRIWVDGKRINYEIVRAGMAWWYRKYSADSILKQCEWEARTAKIGIWSEPNPVAPWDWRNGGRASASQRAFGRSTVRVSPAETIGSMVYVTATGEKYHAAGCRYLRRSMIPMARKDAVRSYSPCSICGGG